MLTSSAGSLSRAFKYGRVERETKHCIPLQAFPGARSIGQGHIPAFTWDPISSSVQQDPWPMTKHPYNTKANRHKRLFYSWVIIERFLLMSDLKPKQLFCTF